MTKDSNKIAAAVLAAGKGKRIGYHLPKVLYPILGKPMLYYTLELLEKVPIKNVNVVVGTRSIDVKASLRNQKVKYVFQEEQLGTAHAAGLVFKELDESVDSLMVFNGDDSAFFEVSTIRDFIISHNISGAKISFITCVVDNALGLGRVLKDGNGNLLKIVEEKDASDQEKSIKEVNVGCYILDRRWAQDALKKIKISGSGEYYITGLVYLALKENEIVNPFKLSDANEWRGVNTQDELNDANERMTVKLIKRKKPTVFIFDIDNTLIDTDAVKTYVNESLIHKVVNKDQQKSLWEEYENVRSKLGYISITDLADNFAEKTNEPKYAESIRNMWYNINFEDFVFPGVYKLMEYIDSKGEIALLSEGDLVYQPMKIKNLRISKFLDEIYVFENKKANVGNIAKIYENRRIILIDDKITDLEAFKKVCQSAVAIHFKRGIYNDLLPQNKDFAADYVVSNIEELTNYIKGLY